MKAFDLNIVYKRIKDTSWWLDWFGIFLGCTIMAAGFVYFINPYNIIPGGVYGCSIVLHNIFPSIQVGTFGYMFDIPLFLIALVLLGTNLGARTFIAAMMTPTIMNTMTYISYPTQAAIESLDSSLLLGGVIDMSHDLMLTTLIGATLIGLGCGIVVRSNATTGGTDIVGMILQKYAHIKFSNGVMLVDGLVVLFGLIVIGLGVGHNNGESSGSWLLSFYSLIAIFISSRVLAMTITGNKDDKLIFVISEKPLDELHNYIIHDLNRTATLLKAQGLYSNGEKQMIFLVCKYKEVNNVKNRIKLADPTSFVVVTDAYDTFGEGWKQLPDAGEIQAE